MEYSTATELKAAIDQARALTRQQVAVALQGVEAVLDERLQAIEARLNASYQVAVDTRLRELMESLNQTARRLRSSGTQSEWIRTLVEASAPYCGKSAVFAVTPEGLLANGHPAIPFASAPAFQSAVESKDTVVAVGTPRELSQAAVAILGVADGRKAYLFPVVVRQNAIAVLYAEPAPDSVLDVSALELLASVAAASIESTETVTVKQPSLDLVRITGVAPPQPVSAPPSWTQLALDAQEQHLRAQRFARTRVAEMLLHRVRQVRSGRRSNNLFGELQQEIEAGREAFRKEFIETCPSMVDYFHLELQRTLAQNRPDSLGPEYPGPLPVGSGSRAG